MFRAFKGLSEILPELTGSEFQLRGLSDCKLSCPKL